MIDSLPGAGSIEFRGRRLPVGNGLTLQRCPLQRRLAAIMSADVVGYSRLMGGRGRTRHVLNALRRELIDPAIAAHSGLYQADGDRRAGGVRERRGRLRLRDRNPETAARARCRWL